jgi:sentrin-specific protease 8
MFVYSLVFAKQAQTNEPTVTKEDVDTLKDDWLTDNVSPYGIPRVCMPLTYLRPDNFLLGRVRHILSINDLAEPIRYLEREQLSQYPTSHIILLRPSMAFMLMQTPNPLTLKEALPDFSSTTHIFLPINDAHNVSVAEGGSHWSLLLVSIIDGVAFHYDSLSPSNWNEANLATQKLSVLLGKTLRFMNLDDSPQQENGSDCGVYVCIQMRHLLLKRLLSANSKEKISMSMGGKMVDANGGRKEMLKIIEMFRKEGERRRS